MKAEHRKELQTNSLADFLGRTVRNVRGGTGVSWTKILLVLAAVLVVLAVLWYFRNRRRENAELWLKLDTNTESRRYFREKIEPHLGNGVRWIRDLRGRNKWRLLAGAKAMLFPIQWEEPFGLAMAEAMVVGTPVLAFPRGAAPELVEDGVTGYIVRNVSEMVSAFKRVGDIDPEICAKLSRDRFSASKMARGYEEIYLKAVERGPEGSNL